MKLLMLDMDGTLLTNDKSVTSKTRECLLGLKKRGIKIGIATGRPVFNVKRALIKYNLEGIIDYIVGLNGVEIGDLEMDVVQLQQKITSDMTRDICFKIKDTDFNMITYTYEDGVFARFDEPRVHRLCTNLQLPLMEYDFACDEQTWNKVLITRNYPFSKDECEWLLALNNEQYHGFITDIDCFEIVNSAVSKASGIQVLCHKMGITMDEVVAFGDSGNDVDMLRAVGISVAMGNAADVVKSVAKFVTLTNEEDGIVYFVEKYMEGRV